MIAFSTNPTPKPYAHIQPMIQVSALPPVTDIATIIPQITGLPAGRRVLMMEHPLGLWTGSMSDADRLAVIPAGFDVAAARAYHVSLFSTLHAYNIIPDLIVMDEECVPWAPDLPGMMDAYGTTDPIIARNFYADMVATCLRRSVSSAFAEVYPDTIPPIINYEDCWGAGQVDKNNWPRWQSGVSRWSSPESYVGWYGIQATNGGAITDPHEWRWRRFIQAVNTIRASLPTCIPWISPACFLDNNWLPGKPLAGPGVRYLWSHLISHIIYSGIDRIVYWNANDDKPNDGKDDVLLDSLLGGRPGKIVTGLPQVGYDAVRVATGNVITNKADYLKMA